MTKPTKSVIEKLRTKLAKLDGTDINLTEKQANIYGKVLFRYSATKISYTKIRYFPTLKDSIVHEDFTVDIILDHKTLSILADKIQNPPRGAGRVLGMVRNLEPGINSIAIGSRENRIEGNKVFITLNLYSTLVAINSEEGKDKVVRVKTRVAPFLKNNLGLKPAEYNTSRDYRLLAQELIESNELTQQDIAELTGKLSSGELNSIVIERQINKQTSWLLDSIQRIIDEPELTKSKCKELGKEIFEMPKNSIGGPEDLMEKILTKYGKNIIFGVPALLNVDGFVSSSADLPRSQFDLLLVNNLSDIEIVELKRPDEYLLKYDASRSKFYMSESLSTAAAQSERYISAIYRENDEELKIQGQSIRKYLQSQLGGTITLSICRPKALIVIGTIHRIAKRYAELAEKDRRRVSEAPYNKNLDHAYKEIKSSFKNIDIITYTELVEAARLRLQAESE